MKQQTRNNFLNWFGTFIDAPLQNVATDDTVNVELAASTIKFNPTLNDICTNGIDFTTIEITQEDNLTTPSTINTSTGEITYTLRDDKAVGQSRTLKYRFKDIVGNLSNIGTILINIIANARATAWRGKDSSKVCSKDGNGNNTGYVHFTTLERFYTDDNTAVIPSDTKLNTSGDPNFVADYYDPSSCPLPPAPTMGEISNTTSGGTRTQVFEVGAVVNPGNKFYVMVYSHGVYVTAVAGDTPTTIATKLKDAVNATTLAEWNDAGSDFSNYKPSATSSGSRITLTLNFGNQFAAGATPN